MKQEYTPPTYKESAFNCPFCNAYANQSWDDLGKIVHGRLHYTEAKGCICAHCNYESIWFNETMVYPDFEGV